MTSPSTSSDATRAREPETTAPAAASETSPLVDATIDRSSLTPSPAKEERGVVHLTRLDDGVAVLRLGATGESAVSFTDKRMRSLMEAIQEIRANPPTGLVITGPAQGLFCVGADIGTIGTISSASQASELSRQGQKVFSEIEKLRCTTVAAIHGACMGGGCELALACDHRIITDDKSSQIGLPEIKLGILPGWGGTQRLPRLIGLRPALKIIGGGEALRASEALATGLVDAVVPHSELLSRACAIAAGEEDPSRQSPPLLDRVLAGEGAFSRLVRKAAAVEAKTLGYMKKKTGGNYPAPLEAADTIFRGLDGGADVGYELEAKRLGQLLVSAESRALQHVFVLSQASKELGKPARELMKDADPVVIGAGVMGAGIGAAFAKAGAHVAIHDEYAPALEKGLERVKDAINHSKSMKSSDKEEAISRVQLMKDLGSAARDADIAIEAIRETLPDKQKVVRALSAALRSDAIIATNTSSLSVTAIAAAATNPERVVGMHFFNPVHAMPLVEIVRGRETSDDTIAKTAALAVRLGKTPIVVEDVPCFLVNRILSPFMFELAHLAKDGYPIADIEKAAVKFGMPMGPARLLDEVGLDIAKHVGESLVAGYGERMSSPPMIEKLLEHQLVGRKSGKGFYLYKDDSDKKGQLNPELGSLLDLEPRKGTLQRDIELRLVMPMVNEAVRCLDEGVAGPRGKNAANQIDLGSVLGFGFAPFRGGIMSYAESVGAFQLHRILKRMEQRYGERFAPAPGIVERAATHGTFFE